MNEFENLLLEDKEFVLNNLPYHLAKAAMANELCDILTEFDFLEHKVSALAPQLLIEDYNLALDFDIKISEFQKFNLKLIKEALQLSAHILAEDKTQLASQLHGRLLSYEIEAVQQLLRQAQQWKNNHWLRPLVSSLVSPDQLIAKTLQGHNDAVNTVAVTLDSQRVISGSSDGTLKVWELNSGKLLMTLDGHTASVNSIALSLDGKYILSGSSDKTLNLWNLETGTKLFTIFGHTGSINAVAISPDGRRCVSGSGISSDLRIREYALKIWDLEERTELHTLYGHNTTIDDVLITPDGRHIISGGGVLTSELSDYSLKVWDLETGVERFSLAGHTGPIYALAVTPDGRHIISAGGSQMSEGCGTSSNNILKVWDIQTGTELFTLKGHRSSVNTVVVTPDGKKIISASSDYTIKIWDLENRRELQTLEQDGYRINSLAISPNGQYLMSASASGTIKVLNIEQFTAESGWYQSTAIPVLSQSNVSNNTTMHITSLAVTNEGQKVISASRNGNLRVWDTNGQELLTISNQGDSVEALAIMPNISQVISLSLSHMVKAWDIINGKESWQLETPVLYPELAVSCNGRIGVSSSVSKEYRGVVRVWNFEKGLELFTLGIHPIYPVQKLAITPDGKFVIVSLLFQKTLHIWSLEERMEILTLQGQTTSSDALAVTPDGQRLISASRDENFSKNSTLTVWDLQSGTQLCTFPDRGRITTKLLVTPDSTKILSVAYLSEQESASCTFKLWDLESRNVIASYRGDNPLTTCAVTPDSITYIVGDVAGKLHFLRLEGTCTY
ncbi:WD-40 repeat protein [Rivularia sp. IAM M-261]|nr:WD-40 repeat protein [Rivularia sp. IAM M-261]